VKWVCTQVRMWLDTTGCLLDLLFSYIFNECSPFCTIVLIVQIFFTYFFPDYNHNLESYCTYCVITSNHKLVADSNIAPRA